MQTPTPDLPATEVTLDTLTAQLGGRVLGDGTKRLKGCATLEDAGPDELAFVIHPRYFGSVADSNAGCVLVSPQHAHRWPDRTCWIHDDPYLALRGALLLLHGNQTPPPVGISEQAWIDPSAQLGELCTIRPGAYIAPRAKLGRRVVVFPGVYIGKDATIGDDCVLHPGVCIYARCVLGRRVVLHSNCVIGQDGLGYATATLPGETETAHHKLPPAGNAVIEDDVEMGAGCCVDRATLASTVVGRGTKFSNHVVIGHGCKVGPHNLFVAGVGLAGSVTTGTHVTIGGQVGIAGHLTIGDRVKIAASSKVMHDIPPDQTWGGTPAQPMMQTKRVLLQQQRLPDLAATVKQLERRLAELEKKLS